VADYFAASRVNNFDIIRLLAALLVLLSHSYALTRSAGDDIFSKALLGYDSAGGFAVTIFFVVSGFLVTRSAMNRSALDYILARVLRIVPGLAFAVLLTVLVVGPLLTGLSLTAYFADPSVRSYLCNILVFPIQHQLADVTRNLPYPHGINGSLWTLPIECGFYVLLIFLVRFRILTSATALGLFAATLAGYLIATNAAALRWENQGPMLWQATTTWPALRFGSAFLAGAALWLLKDRIPLDRGLAIACLIALAVCANTAAADMAYMVCLPYLVIYTALALPAINLSRFGDLSYGVYVLAYPVQQTIIASRPGSTAAAVNLIATPIVLVLAYCSWHLIEKRALRLKPGEAGRSHQAFLR
jgi:peptidoglycan/LPS O-acetylase OafA/YrhL